MADDKAKLVLQGAISRDLWGEAARKLSDKERAAVELPAAGNTNGVGGSAMIKSVLELTQKAQATSEGKKWKFNFRGKEVVVRDILSCIVDWTKKSEQVIDFVVGMDVSGHAALPWSFVKFFLEVCVEQSGNPIPPQHWLTPTISWPGPTLRSMAPCWWAWSS
jgi:hypothetical protein